MEKKPMAIFASIIVLFIITIGIYSYSVLNRDLPLQGVSKCQTHFATYDVVVKSIEDKKYNLLVADIPAKHTYGLMNVKTKNDICGHDGMIFLFDKPGIQSFWNQGTLVDLKLYWMIGDSVVRSDDLVNITDNGTKIYSSILPVNRVVEIIK